VTAQFAALAGQFARNRHLLVVSLLTIMLAGLSAFLSLPRIEDPRITTRNATIITPLPGASATRVEALVTKTIEDRLRELPEIRTIESTSRNGVSVIGIELQDQIGEDGNEQAFSRIRDRLDAAAADLPEGAGMPEFDDMRGAVAYSMILAVAWQEEARSDIGILNRVAEQLGDRLRNLAGTEQVVLFGVAEEEIRVDVDAAEAAAIGLSPAGLAARIAAADARRSAGTIRADGFDLPLEVSGALDSVARVAAVPIADNGRGGLLQVRDIATVDKAWQDPPEQVALHDGRRSILVAARTAPDIRVDRWAAEARGVVASLTTGLPGGIAIDSVFDQSHYTAARLGGLTTNLLAGVACVMLVVSLMMGWRAALIVGAALPLSAALSLFGLQVMGEQIHQMAIFGMIIAIGLLIDNAIVVTDQVIARRRTGQAPAAAVTATIRHLFGPLFASTSTTILGFMPVFLLPGNVGDFVSPIATAVVLALLASFALAMTVIPALAGLLAVAEQPPASLVARRRAGRAGRCGALPGPARRRAAKSPAVVAGRQRAAGRGPRAGGRARDAVLPARRP
jgi:multidrug efflux pump